MTAVARQEVSRVGIGGSEAAAALGIHPYRSRMDLWLEKTGRKPPFEGSERTEWGLDAELAIREWYVRTTNMPVWRPRESMFSSNFPWMRSSPDGIVLRSNNATLDGEAVDRSEWKRGFEAKTADWTVAHRWGDPLADAEVPAEYLIQCMVGMIVTGLETWDLVPTIGGRPPVIYTIERDEELCDSIVDGCREFLDLVESDTPPEIDGSQAWTEYLAEKHPWSREDFVTASEETEGVARLLLALSDQHKELEEKIDTAKNLIRSVIGESSGLLTSQGRFTCKPQKGGINYKLAYEDLVDQVRSAGLSFEVPLERCRNRGSRPLRMPRGRGGE